MKNTKKITISLVTVAVLCLNAFLSPTLSAKSSTDAPHFSISDRANQQYRSGRIPSHTAVASYTGGSEQNGRAIKKSGSYPSYYSSADLGYTSGVDNQLTTDACWAFTHNELLEINLAKKYGVKYDFSEQAMKFETSNITNPLYGYMRNPNGGGNEYYSTAYLARTGSVLEADEPFSLSEIRNVNKDEINRQGMLNSVPMYIFGLNSNNTYNSAAVDKIKELVMQYGAVGSALFYDESPLYQPSSRECYYYDSLYNENFPDIYANHSVTIVGWDDNYSADNFVHKPAGNGAFIVKNSWGLYHNNQSSDYVYVSYYDRHITNEIFATDYEIENSLYDNIYQYDPLGWCRNLVINNSKSLSVTRFVADKPNETVTAVSTYIIQPGTSVKVMICTNGDFKNQSAYSTVYEHTYDAAGYYVMPITPVKLAGNEYFVALELSVPSGSAQLAIQSDIRLLIDNSVNIPNTCYVGSSFNDLNTIENIAEAINSQTNVSSDKIRMPMVCVKAFTKSSDTNSFENISSFTDVTDTRWYAKAVDYAVGAGLFSGVSDNTFEPATEMTRAMFVRVLANLTNINVSDYTDIGFKDIEKNRWYTAAAYWAVTEGIVQGTAPNTFSPYENITRQQMCVMLMRFADTLGMSFERTDQSFVFDDDNRIQNYARQAVYTCREYGIIGGMTDTTFDPRSSATRAQVANMFMNFSQKYVY